MERNENPNELLRQVIATYDEVFARLSQEQAQGLIENMDIVALAARGLFRDATAVGSTWMTYQGLKPPSAAQTLRLRQAFGTMLLGSRLTPDELQYLLKSERLVRRIADRDFDNVIVQWRELYVNRYAITRERVETDGDWAIAQRIQGTGAVAKSGAKQWFALVGIGPKVSDVASLVSHLPRAWNEAECRYRFATPREALLVATTMGGQRHGHDARSIQYSGTLLPELTMVSVQRGGGETSKCPDLALHLTWDDSRGDRHTWNIARKSGNFDELLPRGKMGDGTFLLITKPHEKE